MRLWHHLDSGPRLWLTLSHRARQLAQALRSDRGDSPVPTAIIIVGLAILAAGLVVMATDVVEGWWERIPTGPEDAGSAP